ncbi:MAG TPA: DUF4349 domain-containing protein [Bacteroidia bacterium]|jgi:hypothetical protein|nr:DUF4349 domain-containing protein [Bacteroidia bacterium]
MKKNALALVPVTMFTVFLFSCGSSDMSPDRGYSSRSMTTADSTARDSVAISSLTQTELSVADQNQPVNKDDLKNELRLEQDQLYRSSAPGFLLPFVTSAGRMNKLDSSHRFIRTADMKFRVQSVAQATYRIEDLTADFGGYVADTKLASTLVYNSTTPVSVDSSLETMRYEVSNTLLLRIPAEKLDSALKSLAPLVDYLDYRNVNTQDITLDILANRLQQTRVAKYNIRVTSDIQQNSNHMDVQGAENSMLNQQENSDNALIENLRMDDKVRYSTVSINIYQPQTIRQELVKREKTVAAYEPGFGSQVGESLASGWRGLRVFLAGVILLWPMWMIGLSVLFGIRFYLKKKKV